MERNERNIIRECEEDPSLIFALIKNGKSDLVDHLIMNNHYIINTCDVAGNNVIMKLLKAKQYDLVLKHINKKYCKVNHQNLDGNTIGHMLAKDNSVHALKIVDRLTINPNYIANISNRKGQTALDIAIDNNYACTTFKFLGDKKFNNIDAVSFMNLYNTYIKNNYYGKYTKLSNLEIIVKDLNKKELCPILRVLVNKIIENTENIKNDIILGSGVLLDNIIKSLI